MDEYTTHKISKWSSIWKTLVNLMKDFCQSTSLHGYNNLNNTDSIVAKVLWGILIFAATGLGIAFLVSNTKAFMRATVVTYIESETFPLDVSNLFQTRSMMQSC